MRVFAEVGGSHNTGRVGDVFLGSGVVAGKIRSPRLMLLSSNSNPEWNGRLEVSLGPAEVCGRRDGFMRGRPAGGGEGLVGLGAAGVDSLD